ncbi:MAG: hypothetical protein KDD62_13585, partial [Bdellovibrionales bacterium]|nr:hypothetical protein [Bdellovibrionales bacterium]
MSLRSLIAALLAIWAFCSNAAAQDALQPKERALLDAYRLQLSLEEASSLVKKSFWDFERRVLLKEKIVLLSCMPHVHTTLVYSIENLSDNCREDIKTLLAAYPGSVVGICALHGLNSQPCRDSYAEMYIDRAPNQPAEGRENEDSGLDYYISRIQKTTQNRSDLKERASKTAQRFRDNRDPKASFDLFMQARQAFFNYLPQACESVHNRILESIPPDAKRVSKLPLPDGIKIQDDLLDEWHKFEEERSKDVAQLREEA